MAAAAWWWTDAVGYQVYLPSFADSDGDGWGDLRGVLDRLGYLIELGVDMVWLTPFFRSPMVDGGYDVADYQAVDPRFGDRHAIVDLIEQAHRRGLKVLGDLVVNHTSDRHPWFAAAASSRTDPHRDYYIWRDPAPGGGPPNNWLSHFGGPAWTLHPPSGQYYLHLFRPEQPDLNWGNPRVADRVDEIMTYWFELGLDGFRIDTAAYLVKHPDYPDNPVFADGRSHPVGGATAQWQRQDHRYDIHQPDVHVVHERWRRLADRYDAFLVGEVYELDPVRLAAYVSGERLHSSFWFGLVESDWQPARVRDLVAAAAGPRLSWVQGNHDRRRAASRYGGRGIGVRRSLALHVLMALLPGSLWLYQGEELGLTDGVVDLGRDHDPLARHAPAASRDVVRTPMPWTPGPGLGFTRGTSWIGDGRRSAEDTVTVQSANPGSHLNAVRRLLHTRRAILDRAPAVGEITPRVLTESGDVLALRRGPAWAVLNLADTASVELILPAPAVYDTDDPAVCPERPAQPRPRRLAPQQAMLLHTVPHELHRTGGRL